MKNAVVTGRQELRAGKFLVLEKVEYLDRSGTPRQWEAAQRVNSNGAAVLIPKLVPSGKYLLIRQFRPPCGAYVIEFPAGLIDPGETVEDTAMRELYEETGYRGKITRTLPMCCSSPGLTGECFATAFMEIDESLFPEVPEQHLESTEDIELFAVAPQEIPDFLAQARQRGDVIDVKIEFFFALCQE